MIVKNVDIKRENVLLHFCKWNEVREHQIDRIREIKTEYLHITYQTTKDNGN